MICAAALRRASCPDHLFTTALQLHKGRRLSRGGVLRRAAVAFACSQPPLFSFAGRPQGRLESGQASAFLRAKARLDPSLLLLGAGATLRLEKGRDAAL